MFNLDKNKIYKIHYYINNIEYFSFSKLAGKNIFRDVITKILYRFEDISNVIYHEVDPKLIKYYLNIYKKEKNINVFLLSNYIYENIFYYIDILRFFDLKYEDLIKNNKNKDIKNKIINKCEKYLKKYFDDSIFKNYISNIKKFDDINYILSYKSPEILNDKNEYKLFWCDKYIPFEKYESILCGFSNNILNYFDTLKIDINTFIYDKQSYKSNIHNIKLIIKKEYKEKVLNTLKNRINISKNTIKNEKEYAKSTNDDDLIFEINTIEGIIFNLENTILDIVHDDILNVELYNFWPDLLYPIPSEIENIKKIYNTMYNDMEIFYESF
jgi:hypothetical protein